MAVCGVQNTYVHSASHPSGQAALFLDRPNLMSTDQDGRLIRATEVNRPEDMPLIHWILEFDKGSELSIGGLTHTCPKSNRFIATYDPLNFVLHIDGGFDLAMRQAKNPLETILLSGYQMLSEPLQGGGSGLKRIEESWEAVDAWKLAHPGCMVHFEFASTQDLAIRKALAENLAPRADSVGCNEQEAIQVLEALGEAALARECAQSLDSVTLFRGCSGFSRNSRWGACSCTCSASMSPFAKPSWRQDSECIRNGMALAATLAAAKAGTGSLEREENLLWAHGSEVSDISIKELQNLAAWLKQSHGMQDFEETGMGECASFRVVAMPTILIDKPVTLVGMGDTISSLSLVGAR